MKENRKCLPCLTLLSFFVSTASLHSHANQSAVTRAALMGQNDAASWVSLEANQRWLKYRRSCTQHTLTHCYRHAYIKDAHASYQSRKWRWQDGAQSGSVLLDRILTAIKSLSKVNLPDSLWCALMHKSPPTNGLHFSTRAIMIVAFQTRYPLPF